MSIEPGPFSVPRTKAGGNLLLVLLSLSYLLAYFDRLLMAVVGEMVKREFLLSDKQLALLTGAAFVLIYGICGIGTGWLIDRFSRKRVIAISLAAWSLFTIACGWSSSFLTLALARAGVGAGESAIVPAALSTIGDVYPPQKRPLAVACFFVGGMVGILLCFLVGTWMAAAHGWRSTFLIAGPPGLLLALAVAVFVREPPREAAAPLSAATAADASTFRQIWENKPLVWLLAAGAIATFVNMGMINWLPNFFIRSHGMSLKHVGLVFGPVLAGGMAVGMLGGGWIGNRLSERSVTALIDFSGWVTLASIPIYLMAFWVASLPLALVAMFVGTASSVLYSPSFTAAWQTIAAPQTRGTAAGISSFANASIGGAFAVFFIGAVSDALASRLGADSLRYALMIGMAFSLISGLMFFRARNMVRDAARISFT